MSQCKGCKGRLPTRGAGAGVPATATQWSVMFQARGRSSITGHRPGTSGEPELPGHEGISRHYRYNCIQINKDDQEPNREKFN